MHLVQFGYLTELDAKQAKLVHLGPFGCLTKLGAKQAELVQKFVTRSRVGIFRNEHTRSTPLDPKIKNLVCFVLLG